MKTTFLLSFLLVVGIFNTYSQSKKDKHALVESLSPEKCNFQTTGRNEYFILEPGYQLILEGKEKKETRRLEITVLDEKAEVGREDTRVVEEKETVNGNVVEISRNFFAYCPESGNMFYLGKEVDMYKDGKVVSHDGSWAADEGKNRPGVMMPGTCRIGTRYNQELAPGVAMDRAEIVCTTEKVKTRAGNFKRCLKVKETTPLTPGETEYKFYAPGIGLVRDGNLILVKYGFVK